MASLGGAHWLETALDFLRYYDWLAHTK